MELERAGMPGVGIAGCAGIANFQLLSSFIKHIRCWAVLAWMPVPLCHGWLHDEFQVNAELSNSGMECLKAGQGRFAFKPEWTICACSTQSLRGG